MLRVTVITTILALLPFETAALGAPKRPTHRPPLLHRVTLPRQGIRLAARPSQVGSPKAAKLGHKGGLHLGRAAVPPRPALPVGPTNGGPQLPPTPLPFVIPRLPSNSGLGINAPPSTYGGGGGNVGPQSGGSFGGPPIAGGSFGGGRRTGGSFGDGR